MHLACLLAVVVVVFLVASRYVVWVGDLSVVSLLLSLFFGSSIFSCFLTHRSSPCCDFYFNYFALEFIEKMSSRAIFFKRTWMDGKKTGKTQWLPPGFHTSCVRGAINSTPADRGADRNSADRNYAISLVIDTAHVRMP